MNDHSQKVVYVLSSNFSGSTLLALHLASFEKAYLVGEAAYIYRKNKDGSWRHSKFCTPCRTRGEAANCPVWGDAMVAQMRMNPGAYFPTLGEKLEVPVGFWVDSSKDIDWIAHQLTQGAEAYIIHITKSVEGFLGSLVNRERLKGGLGFQAQLWARQNIDHARFAEQRSIPYMAVKYEDFVIDSDQVLGQIAQFLGETYRPNAPYWERDMHFVKGNPAASVAFQPSLAGDQAGLNAELYREGGRELFLDEKWRQLLTLSQVKAVYGLPDVQKASAAFGYTAPPEVAQAKGSGFDAIQYRLQSQLHRLYRGLRYVY